MLINVVSLSGDSHCIELVGSPTLGHLQAAMARQTNVPIQRLRLLHNSTVLSGAACELTELLGKDTLLADLGMVPNAVLQLAVVPPAWLWADREGLVVDRYRRVPQLEALLEWVTDDCSDDTETEEEGHGIIRIIGADFPLTAVAVLQFLQGCSEECRREHPPVIPGLDPDSHAEVDVDWSRAPWRDIQFLQELGDAGTKALQLPWETDVLAPEAAATLACCSRSAKPEAIESHLQQCQFYTCGGLRDDAMDYFYHRHGTLTPYLIVCASPEQQTISFAYQCSFWHQY